jgi:hypothetical protein
MATNGVAAQQALAPILAAVETMQGNVDRARKEQAVQFLDTFQKTVRHTLQVDGSITKLKVTAGRLDTHIQHPPRGQCE